MPVYRLHGIIIHAGIWCLVLYISKVHSVLGILYKSAIVYVIL